MRDLMTNELRRLRNDFEKKASEYVDLTLSVYYIAVDHSPDTEKFRRPNYSVMLWQYLGHFTPNKLPAITPTDVTNFGMRGAQLSAFGLIEGADTEVFRRMAYRAGSLVPQQATRIITTHLLERWNKQAGNGKLFFATNSDPLSVWLNLVFVYTATFHPERFQRKKLAVDPFAASLTVFDHLLEQLEAHSGRRRLEIPAGPASLEVAPTSFGQAALQLVWPSRRWLRHILIAVIGLVVILFAFWNSLPDGTKDRFVSWLF